MNMSFILSKVRSVYSELNVFMKAFILISVLGFFFSLFASTTNNTAPKINKKDLDSRITEVMVLGEEIPSQFPCLENKLKPCESANVNAKEQGADTIDDTSIEMQLLEIKKEVKEVKEKLNSYQEELKEIKERLKNIQLKKTSPNDSRSINTNDSIDNEEPA